MLVEGRVQKSVEKFANVVHLMGVRVYDRSHELERLSEDRQADIEPSRAGAFAHDQSRGQPPQGMWRHPRNVRVMPKSRDFH
jgi:error-prone DNA polymerase